MIHWIIGSAAIKLLAAAGASATLLSSAFGNPGNYVFGPSNGYGSQTVIVKSIQQAQAAAPQGYPYAIADIEKWSYTPVWQQQHPVTAIRQIADIFAAYGTQTIGAPSDNLFGGWQGYIDSDVARAARWTFGWEVQNQTTELSPSDYSRWFSEIRSQATAVNPDVEMLAGLTTDERFGTVGPDELMSAYQAGLDAGAQGFWLNVPSGPDSYCPTCTDANPDPAVQLLQNIYP